MPPFTISLSSIPHVPAKGTKMVGEFHDYLINKGFNRIGVKSMCTENINSCTAGLISNGERNFMFHVAPELQSLNKVKEDLAKQIYKLGNPKEQEMNGFICGGWELNNGDKASVQSFNLYNTIADTLDELGVNFTMFCGKKKTEALDNIYAINQHISLWSNSFRDLINDKFVDPQKIMKKLEDTFQFVEKNDNHIIDLS